MTALIHCCPRPIYVARDFLFSTCQSFLHIYLLQLTPCSSIASIASITSIASSTTLAHIILKMWVGGTEWIHRVASISIHARTRTARLRWNRSARNSQCSASGTNDRFQSCYSHVVCRRSCLSNHPWEGAMRSRTLTSTLGSCSRSSEIYL